VVETLFLFLLSLGLASAHRRRRGSFFILDDKETNNQGLHRFLCDNNIFIGIKDCYAILVKSYGNLDSGSLQALTLAYPNTPA